MPAPSFEPYEWATDTNHPAGSDPWSGQPLKVDPGATLKAEGFTPAQRPAAEHVNHVLSRVSGWVTYMRDFFDESADEFAYPSSKGRAVTLMGVAGVSDDGGGFSDLANAWQPDSTAGDEGSMVTTRQGARLKFDIKDRVPSGATITRVDCILQQGATAGSTMRLSLYKYTPNIALPTSTSAVLVSSNLIAPGDDNTTLQTLSLTGLSEIVQPTEGLWVEVLSRVTTGGATIVADRVRCLVVSYTTDQLRDD